MSIDRPGPGWSLAICTRATRQGGIELSTISRKGSDVQLRALAAFTVAGEDHGIAVVEPLVEADVHHALGVFL